MKPNWILIMLIMVALFGCKTRTASSLSSLGTRSFPATKFTVCDTCKYYGTSGFAVMTKPAYPSWNLYVDQTVKMKITLQDSIKQYKVWFDKRYIMWTSDSTFTILDKPKL